MNVRKIIVSLLERGFARFLLAILASSNGVESANGVHLNAHVHGVHGVHRCFCFLGRVPPRNLRNHFFSGILPVRFCQIEGLPVSYHSTSFLLTRNRGFLSKQLTRHFLI